MQSALNDWLCMKAVIERQRKRNTFALFQAGNHGKQIVCARVALVAEHGVELG